jgi:hypothetical protein
LIVETLKFSSFYIFGPIQHAAIFLCIALLELNIEFDDLKNVELVTKNFLNTCLAILKKNTIWLKLNKKSHCDSQFESVAILHQQIVLGGAYEDVDDRVEWIEMVVDVHGICQDKIQDCKIKLKKEGMWVV